MFQGMFKHISPKVHWRLGAYSINAMLAGTLEVWLEGAQFAAPILCKIAYLTLSLLQEIDPLAGHLDTCLAVSSFTMVFKETLLSFTASSLLPRSAEHTSELQ